MIERGRKPIEMVFPLGEAFLDFFYGKIRQGKTYMAAVLCWQYLRQGCVVYCSFPIEFDGYDERKIWWKRCLVALGLKDHFLVVPKENLHIFNFWEMTSEQFFDFFSSKNDCVFIVDEAQWPFDSYVGTKMEKDHRISIFATGHFNRTVVLVSQRPMQIHTSLRGNINRYYKMEKTFKGFWFIPPRFQVTEFQDLRTDGVPDESRVLEFDEETKQMVETDEYKYAESQKRFFGSKKIFASYNSKYLRGGAPSSQENFAYEVVVKNWVTGFLGFFRKRV